MRLVFLGSPEVVIPVLETLTEEASVHGHQLVGVVSQPARPVGRRARLEDPPVAVWAKDRQLSVLQPQKAGDPAFLEKFAAWQPDVAITAAYGQILTDEFLAIPQRATINLHPSLLPSYRGATPVQSALLDGATQTGISILFTVKKLDAGPIIWQEKLSIDPFESSELLTKRLFLRGAKAIWKALELLQSESFHGTPQDENQVTRCRKIAKHDGLLDWNQTAPQLYNRYRAFQPWPGVFTDLEGRRIALTDITLPILSDIPDSQPLPLSSEQSLPEQSLPEQSLPEQSLPEPLLPGAVSISADGQGLLVQCRTGQVIVRRVKPAGSKDMTAQAFWNGQRNKDKIQFG